MPQVIVNLDISREEIMLYYQGSVQQVQAKAVNGQHVRFPLSLIRQFVTEHGVKGKFAIMYDLAGKFESITRLA